MLSHVVMQNDLSVEICAENPLQCLLHFLYQDVNGLKVLIRQEFSEVQSTVRCCGQKWPRNLNEILGQFLCRTTKSFGALNEIHQASKQRGMF